MLKHMDVVVVGVVVVAEVWWCCGCCGLTEVDLVSSSLSGEGRLGLPQFTVKFSPRIVLRGASSSLELSCTQLYLLPSPAPAWSSQTQSDTTVNYVGPSVRRDC